VTASVSGRPVITLLLSTFNGERFLHAQLDSFVAQSHQDWVLYWRDDGSDDATLAIMRDFAAGLGAGRCVESPSSGPHLGACESFLTLLAECATAEMVAFADQDDVWLPEKLRRAADHLAASGSRPALYCARQLLVDEALACAKLSVAHSHAPDFPASLTQNIANGNTLVMNAAAAALVATMGRPEGTVHDWWSYIVVSACGGDIIFDEQPQVLYRLHNNNLIGCARPLPARAVAAIRRGPTIFMTIMRRHADMLAAQANRLTPQARQDLKIIQRALHGGFFRRLAALRCPRFRRRTLLENFLFSYWFVTSKPPVPAHRPVAKQSPANLPFGTKVRADPLKSNR
jgi:glycosyltransferase involved in cell wall biosynthesis